MAALGVALRLFRLDHQSLWIDEILTAGWAAQPLRTILFDPTVNQNFPPLHNFVVHTVFAALGDGEWVLRLPSVVFGTLSIVLLGLLTSSWLGRPAGLASAFLLAISPFHLWYSQEARPYALLLFLCLLSIWFAQRLVRPCSGVPTMAGFVLTTAAMLYSHLVAAPIVALVCGFVLLRAAPGTRRRLAVAVALVAVLLLPQVFRSLGHPPNAIASQEYRFSPAHLPYTLWAFGTGYSLGPSLTELRAGRAALEPYHHLIPPVLGLFTVLLLTGAWQIWKRFRPTFWVLTFWLVGPVGFALIGSAVTAHPFNVRYAILAFPPTLVLIAAGLVGLPWRKVRVAALLSLAAVSASALWNYYSVPKYQREDNRAAARYLAANASPGDLVVVTAPYTTLALQHYGVSRDLELLPYPSGARGTAADLAELDRRVGARPRVWLFQSRTFHGDRDGSMRRHLERRLARDREFAAAGVQVVGYRPR
jgi:mannosyltransferase